MRCKACDKMLNDYENSRKDRLTGEFVDLCSDCYTVSTKAMSDFETDVDNYVDFGGEDVYNLDSSYRVAYDTEGEF